MAGHSSYVIDTDWLVRVPGRWFVQFCRGPLVDFGAMLDRRIAKLTAAFVLNIRHPGIEDHMTPMAVGAGIFVTLLLFTGFLLLKL